VQRERECRMPVCVLACAPRASRQRTGRNVSITPETLAPHRGRAWSRTDLTRMPMNVPGTARAVMPSLPSCFSRKVNMLCGHILRQPDTIRADEELIPILVHFSRMDHQDGRFAMSGTYLPSCHRIERQMDVVPAPPMQAPFSDGGNCMGRGAVIKIFRWRHWRPTQRDGS